VVPKNFVIAVTFEKKKLLYFLSFIYVLEYIYISFIFNVEIFKYFVTYNTGWTVRGSNPGGGEISRTLPKLP